MRRRGHAASDRGARRRRQDVAGAGGARGDDPAHRERPEAGGDEAGVLWVQLASRPAAAALYPRPLSGSAAVTLAREHLGAEAAEEFCRACHTATGGNPLFLRELLRA